LSSKSVRHLEPVADVAPAFRDALDGLLEIPDPKDQDRLITGQVLSEEQAGGLSGQPHHGDPGAESLDGENRFGTEGIDIVRDVSGCVPARLIDEVQLLEHVR
jgi:hypothetical protein